MFLAMAKVTGPLFSISARGKIADAMVYFPWKGLSVVREWKIPANPQSAGQGDRREMLGGLGRAPKFVQTGSDFYDYAKAVEPAGQTWLSYFVKYIMTTYFTNLAGYVAVWDEWQAHAAQADFTTRAEALGLTTFQLAYKSHSSHFYPGMQLYCLAKFGCDMYLLDNLKFPVSPYTTALASWADAEIVELVADFTV